MDYTKIEKCVKDVVESELSDSDIAQQLIKNNFNNSEFENDTEWPYLLDQIEKKRPGVIRHINEINSQMNVER